MPFGNVRFPEVVARSSQALRTMRLSDQPVAARSLVSTVPSRVIGDVPSQTVVRYLSVDDVQLTPRPNRPRLTGIARRVISVARLTGTVTPLSGLSAS